MTAAAVMIAITSARDEPRLNAASGAAIASSYARAAGSPGAGAADTVGEGADVVVYESDETVRS